MKNTKKKIFNVTYNYFTVECVFYTLIINFHKTKAIIFQTRFFRKKNQNFQRIHYNTFQNDAVNRKMSTARHWLVNHFAFNRNSTSWLVNFRTRRSTASLWYIHILSRKIDTFQPHFRNSTHAKVSGLHRKRKSCAKANVLSSIYITTGRRVELPRIRRNERQQH